MKSIVRSIHAAGRIAVSALLSSAFLLSLSTANAQSTPDACKGLPAYGDFKNALTAARSQNNGGYNHDMWGVLVNRDGIVCAVAYTGKSVGDQWPGSRLIAAEKANTANAFSLPNFSLSTANLYYSSQPAGPLYGLLSSNPVDISIAYAGNGSEFGQQNDPMVGKRVGGVVVFGGGLALYDKQHHLLGALGVSGDSSCADHNIAWRTRKNLALDYVPGGVTSSKTHPDNIVYDISTLPGHPAGVSPSGWGHPNCGEEVVHIAMSLPEVSK